ncbi:hypothetical protein H6G13_14580 [Pseudanabaena sp. FACHB-2040]|nr:hypothetical protein [Pseudanabaena sp. FACHB-2040]
MTVALGVAWGIVALLFFLLFSSPGVDGEQPGWFLVGITILEAGAFAVSSMLCFRNWRSSQIVSGRGVWLWIGLGLLSYTLGNLLFFLWGTVWGLDPAVSLGDFFYILSYIFLAGGMLQAVLPRRLNLEPPQWLIVAGLGLGGVLIAYFVNYQVVGPSPTAEAAPPVVQLVQTVAPQQTPLPAEGAAPVVPALEEEPNTAPAWVLPLDQRLEPFQSAVGLLYVVADCILLVIAATLLVAFWGGRFSQSWKLIAIAAFCLYIADMFFAYSVNVGTYQEGSLWEVFWTFSAIFFGLGAVVEHAISTQSRRSTRRRRA